MEGLLSMVPTPSSLGAKGKNVQICKDGQINQIHQAGKTIWICMKNSYTLYRTVSY